MNLPGKKSRKQSLSVEDEIEVKICKLKIQCKYKTSPDQILYILGGIKELGSWNESDALEMTTNTDLYPIWETKQDILCPIGKPIEYVYFIKNKDSSIEYEVMPQNIKREFIVKQQGNYVILNNKGDTTLKVKNLSNVESYFYRNDSENDDEIKENDITFESDSIYITTLKPLDLISYENNKMNIELSLFNSKIDKKLTDERIIYVTDYLPIIIKKNSETNTYEMELNENSSIRAYLYNLKMKKKMSFLWVGMLKNYFDFEEDEIYEISDLLEENNFYMIYPEKKDWDKHIIFLNEIVFQIFVDSTSESENQFLYDSDNYFRGFHRVNRVYADRITSIMNEKDIVIINDIVLSLVPNAIKQKNINCSVGFYVHSPLPSSDMIKSFPCYKEIIKSILLCDVIGFHMYYSARNFMTILKRFFGIFPEKSKKGFFTIPYFGRNIIIHIKQAKISLDFLQELIKDPEAIKYQKNYQEIIGNKFGIVSIDHLNLLSVFGIKIRAIELLLDSNPELIDKIMFIMWIKELPRKNNSYYRDVIIKMVNKLKTKFNNNNLINLEFVEESNLYRRLSLFKTCNMFLYLKEYQRHCVFPFEFISMQNEEKNYSLIISENCNASICIKSAIQSNEYNAQFIATKIKECYYGQIKPNFQDDYDYLKSNSTIGWINDFILDIKRSQLFDSNNKISVGMNLTYNILQLNKKFIRVQEEQFSKIYQIMKNRIFFIDFENTLLEIDESLIENSIKLKKKDSSSSNDVTECLNSTQSKEEIKQQEKIKYQEKRIHQIISNLAKNEKNLVFVLSKYEIERLNKIFGDIPDVGLCGENGYYYKYPHSNELKKLVEIGEKSWRDTVINILQAFTEKTEGSYIIELDSRISWVYSNCDYYLAQIQVNEIRTHLQSIFNVFDIEDNNSCVNIKPKNVNKAAFVAEILKNEFSKGNVDYICCIGDDNTDEEVFNYLTSAEKYFCNFDCKVKLLSCTIGRKPSSANYYFNEVNDCIEYLEMLTHSDSYYTSRICSSYEELNRNNLRILLDKNNKY